MRASLVLTFRRELDILMLATVFPPYCSVTAKSSLKLLPFLGWFSKPRNVFSLFFPLLITSRSQWPSLARYS